MIPHAKGTSMQIDGCVWHQVSLRNDSEHSKPAVRSISGAGRPKNLKIEGVDIFGRRCDWYSNISYIHHLGVIFRKRVDSSISPGDSHFQIAGSLCHNASSSSRIGAKGTVCVFIKAVFKSHERREIHIDI